MIRADRLLVPSLAAILAAAPLAVSAATARASLEVGARVVARAEAEVHHLRSEVEVSAEDVARGYLELPRASRLHLYSNSRNGCLLVFSLTASWVRSVAVSGLAVPAEIAAPEGWIAQPWTGSYRSELELGYHFELDPGLEPGTYPWPLEVAVRPR